MSQESPSFNHVRRADRAVRDASWIRAFLHRAAYASIATCLEGQPFITTRTFVYDEAANAIYVHGAKGGRFAANIERNPKVCLSVSRMERLLPAQAACEFSVEYASVVVFGHASLVREQTEAIHALQLLLHKYFPHLHPGEHYRTMTSAEVERTAVYRIDIERWSGKQNRTPANFPGAFFYDEDMSH